MSEPVPRAIPVTTTMIDAATAKAQAMGAINNSILSGRGNTAGFLGELAVAVLLGATLHSTKDFDCVMTDGRTIDVKTKQTLYEPQMRYEGSVAATSLHQKCDIYVFTRVLWKSSAPTFVYVMGWITRQDFYMLARKLEMGDYDPSNRFVVKAACYNIQYSELIDIRELGGGDV